MAARRMGLTHRQDLQREPNQLPYTTRRDQKRRKHAAITSAAASTTMDLTETRAQAHQLDRLRRSLVRGHQPRGGPGRERLMTGFGPPLPISSAPAESLNPRFAKGD